MALSEKDLKQILDIIEKTGRKLIGEGKKKNKGFYQATERRLRAYPTLKANIQRYKADIKDIAHEDMGKSADIIMFQSNSGKSPERDLEELREEKIFALTEKLYRDSKNVEEMDIAINYVKTDPYYKIITMTYLEERQLEDIAEALNCDKTTIWRNRKRLIRQMSIVLYGAEAI